MLGFIGGTGPEGMGLAARFALTGEPVLIGSRSPDRAAEAVARLRAMLPEAQVDGGRNEEVAARAEVVFLTIPYDGQLELLPKLARATAGKIVVSTVSALKVEKGRVFARPVPRTVFTEVPGVRVLVEGEGLRWLLEVTSELAPLVRTLARFPVCDLEVVRPSLAEVFRRGTVVV